MGTDIGFRFSKIKTVYMHICQKRGFHLDPQLSPIPVVEELYLTGDYPLNLILNVKKKGLRHFCCSIHVSYGCQNFPILTVITIAILAVLRVIHVGLESNGYS